MSLFKQSAEDYQRLDWLLFREGCATRYEDLAVMSRDLDWLKAHDYEIIEFNCKDWLTASDMHSDLSMKLDFPGYYGRNLDALRECLRGVHISNARGWIMVFRLFDDFANRNDEVSRKLLDIIADAAWVQLLFGKLLAAFVHAGDREFKIESFGAQHLILNSSERVKRFQLARSKSAS